jgi:hypothetical protein
MPGIMGKPRAEQVPFMDNVELDMVTGCWNYITQPSQIYPKRLFRGEMIGAHVVVAQLFLNYDRSSGLQVLHKCDNSRCCNPKHLYIGTQSQNIRDCVARGHHHEATRTHCPYGHEYTTESTYWRPDGKGRYCNTCRVQRDAARYAAGLN